MKSILILSILLLLCSLNESVHSFFFNSRKENENPSNNNVKQDVTESTETVSEPKVKEKANGIENYKKSIVLVKSRAEVPFTSDTEEVKFLINIRLIKIQDSS